MMFCKIPQRRAAMSNFADARGQQRLMVPFVTPCGGDVARRTTSPGLLSDSLGYEFALRFALEKQGGSSC
jgi:hypothetical protein